jgi:hypothetical protein
VALTNDNRAREQYLREIGAFYPLKNVLELDWYTSCCQDRQTLQMMALQTARRSPVENLALAWV